MSDEKNKKKKAYPACPHCGTRAKRISVPDRGSYYHCVHCDIDLHRVIIVYPNEEM